MMNRGLPISPPPALAAAIARLILDHEDQESYLGDLEEEYRQIAVSSRGRRAARIWYWRQAFSTFALLGTRRRPPAPSGDSIMSQLIQNLRFALRMVRRSPGFAAIAVLTLGLGIGFTTAIFSVVRPVLYSSLPYPEPDRLVMVWEQGADGQRSNTGYLTFRDLESTTHTLASTAAMSQWQPVMSGNGEPERLNGQRATSRFFEVLGVQPLLGRGFLPEEDQAGKNRVAVLSWGLWQRRFGGDPGILGRQISLSEIPYMVVGVMPAGFANLLSPQAEIWAPLGYDASLPWACRSCRHLRAVGRLRPGVSPDQAARELSGISVRLVQEHPADYPRPGVEVVSLQTQITENVRPVLLIILGAVGFVLLMACGNTANLLIGRGIQRQGEFALRRALGADRRQLVGQMLTESVVLSLLGAALGIGVAWASVRGVVLLAPATIPRLSTVRVDAVALAFTAVVAVLTGLVFGLAPAFLSAAGSTNSYLADAGRHSLGRSRHMVRRALVIGEVCLALTLLMGATLLVRSMGHLLGVDPGFDDRNVLTLEVSASGTKYQSNEATVLFFDQALAALRVLPGVQATGGVSQLPLAGDFDQYGVLIEDKPISNPELAPSADRYGVTPGYLEAMRIPVIEGRPIAEGDTRDADPVILVNQAFAHGEWPGQSALGKRIKTGGPAGRWRTVVGVVGDVRHVSLESPQTYQIYVPEPQWENGDGSLVLVVRSRTNPRDLIKPAQAAIWSIDPNQPINRIATLSEVVTKSTAQRRFVLLLFQCFAGAALILSSIGIYGVLAAGVAERTREFGIRSALGATRGGLLTLVMGQGFGMIAVGLGLGIPAAVGMSRVLRGMLYEVSPADPTALIITAAVLAGVGFLASLVPALRATRSDPLHMMRTD